MISYSTWWYIIEMFSTIKSIAQTIIFDHNSSSSVWSKYVFDDPPGHRIDNMSILVGVGTLGLHKSIK